MIKRLLTILLVAAVGLAAHAQQKQGRWQLFPGISGTWTDVIETPGKTYLHNGPSLFSLSDDDNESYVYNSFNKLSSSEAIGLVRYNAQGKYLLVAYADGNLDLLYDDGSVVNMAEIKDAILSTTRGINDVAFADGRIYVATDFGLVVYDDQRHLVLESGIFGKKVTEIFVMGDHLVLRMGTALMASPLDVRHNTESAFTKLTDIYGSDMAKINDTMLAYLHSSKAVYSSTIDFTANTARAAAMGITGVDKLYRQTEGFYALEAKDIAMVDAEGKVTRTARPEAYATAPLFFETLKSVWAATPQGLTRLDISGSAPTVLMQPYMPDAVTVPLPAQLEWASDGSRVYVTNIDISFFFSCVTAEAGADLFTAKSYVSEISDGKVTDVAPTVTHPTTSPDFDRAASQKNYDRILGGTTRLAVDPNDPSTYYVATLLSGGFAVRNGELVAMFNANTTGAEKPVSWSEQQNGIAFDAAGNLWVGFGLDCPMQWLVLPEAKVRNIEKATEADWIKVTGMPSTYNASRDVDMISMHRSPYNVFIPGGWNKGFVAQATKGTPLSFSDDKFVHQTHVIDQNGNTLNPTFTINAAEDLDGTVWFATDQGVFYISDVAELVSDTYPHVHRPVVPRNDGSGLGDYLLETQKINSLAVDHSNRKWLATDNAGVYLVSADGTEIIANYTAENSALPSNTVFSVAVSPTGNEVFFATPNGVACFDSDSSPAADDYSEVYAYPNPVRPDYTGWITVAGLMDDSLVKIADAAGNVFFQGRSEGGMISWDGCDPSGRRVRSGVYYVYASQNASGNASGAVTKILVIN